jgi:hypothetical protein
MGRANRCYDHNLLWKAWAAWMQAHLRQRRTSQLHAHFAKRLVCHAVAAWQSRTEQAAVSTVQLARAAFKRARALGTRAVKAWRAVLAHKRKQLEHELWAAQHCARLYTHRALREWRRRVAKWREQRAAQEAEAADLLCRGWESWRQVAEHRRCGAKHLIFVCSVAQ